MGYILSSEIIEYRCDFCRRSLFGVKDALHGNGRDETYAYCNKDCADSVEDAYFGTHHEEITYGDGNPEWHSGPNM